MKPKRRYFVTGTDTGVGKTFVTSSLARLAVANRHRVFAFKPIETGTTAELGEDQLALVNAAGAWQRGKLRGVYQFAFPAAPLMSAEAEHREIDLDQIKSAYESGQERADLVLVEGAGGARVPVTRTHDMLGLALVLELPLLVVARAGLGTINHSLLTIEAAERFGLEVSALVLSHRPGDDRLLSKLNAEMIRRSWPGTVIIFDGDDAVLAPLVCPLVGQ